MRGTPPSSRPCLPSGARFGSKFNMKRYCLTFKWDGFDPLPEETVFAELARATTLRRSGITLDPATYKKEFHNPTPEEDRAYWFYQVEGTAP